MHLRFPIWTRTLPALFCMAAGTLFLLFSVRLAADTELLPTHQEPSMSKTTTAVATAYYAAFTGAGPLDDVPMQEDLTFASPRFQLTSAAEFRGALRQLFSRVQSLTINAQLQDADAVLTFYQLDLGGPDGPIPMAERLRVVEGRLAEVELIFDSARLPRPPAE